MGDKSQWNKIHPVHLNTKKNRLPSPLYLNHVPLATTQIVWCLGLHLDRRLTWAIHIHLKRLTLNNCFRQIRSLLTSKHVNLKNIYTLFLRPIRIYGIQRWGAVKFSNIDKKRMFHFKCLRQITKALYYVSNDTYSTPGEPNLFHLTNHIQNLYLNCELYILHGFFFCLFR